MRTFQRLFLCATFVIVLGGLAAAQIDTARIQGTVLDQTGAAVPAAAVTITNLGTGRSLTADSNESGFFTTSGLTPGRYRVEIKQGSFKTYTQEVTLQVGQVAPLNVTLQPGSVEETVEVKSDIPLVESATSNISEVIVGRQVTELPLNGRNFTQLATLAPGVTRGQPNNQATGAGNQAETFRYGTAGGAALSVNGLRPQANNFLLDGVDNNESLVNTIIIFPPAEAIQEFRVDTSVAPAEYGRAGGAIVNTTYKSGTNDWHGSAFWFHRNDNLDARRYFDKKFNPTTGEENPKEEFRRHQFGGTFGGPIIKNKLFFFGDYSGWRQFLPLDVDRATVPTALMRQGNFSEVPTPIIDPITGAPFPGNIIPADRINPVGQAYLNAFPLPNCGPAIDPNCGDVQRNFRITRNQIQTFDDFDVRVDWNIRTNDTLFGRFSYGDDKQTTSSRLPALPAGFGSGNQINHPRSFVLGQTHVFSPAVINEFRFGFVRTRFGFEPPFQNEPISANLGIPGANPTPLLGGGALIGGFNNQLEYTGDFGPYIVPQNTFQYSDALSWNRGAHTLRFGASIIRRQVNLFRPNRGKGFFFLFGDGGGQSPTRHEVADLLAGFVERYDIGPPFGMVGTRNWENGFYVQDDWRVNRRLTLNLGLRYDLYTWPVEVQNRQANFDVASGRIILATDDNRSFMETDKNNFAPRIGFAFDMFGTGQSVLRGGYGVFYFVDRGGIDNQLAQNPPFSGFSSFNYTNGFRITLSGQAPLNSNDSRLATLPLPTGDVNNVDLNNPTNVTVFSADPDNRNSYVQQWNLQVQQQLGTNTAATIAYVGTKGTKLATYYNLNRQFYGQAPGTRLFPLLNDINVQETNGSSIYHGLQTQLERRLSRGVQFTASYTWSHTIDDSPGAFDNQTNRFSIQDFERERGNSNEDLRHRFVFSSLIELPFGRGRALGNNWGGALDNILGGWQINPIVTLQSGFPVDLVQGGNPRTRPDLVGNPQVGEQFDSATGDTLWFNPAAFAPVPTVAFGGDTVNARPGTTPRNFLYGPPGRFVDLALFKNFRPTERFTVQFRSEFFNLFNTPQFAQPVFDLGDPNFGRITNVRLASERQIQLALRLSF